MHNPNLCFDTPPTNQELESSIRKMHYISQECLRCFLLFPQNAIIKESIIVILVDQLYRFSVKTALADLVENGFIKQVYKKNYSMQPFIHSALKDQNLLDLPQLPNFYFPHSIDEEDIIYSDSSKHISTMTNLEFLHLGRFNSSVTHHIEVANPDLFFKGMEKLIKLRYISFRGISMIIELPKFITNLDKLQILDLKSCHNLEEVPPDIGRLWSSLTHLDMSECYILGHMPASLAELRNLQILKGFLVGETEDEESCKLSDLASFMELKKLHIYTSVITFPQNNDLSILERLGALRKLKISWGGCSRRREKNKQRPDTTRSDLVTSSLTQEDLVVDKKTFKFKLVKLDLQCVPETVTRSWLRPSNFRDLKKLYIKGGKFYDLGQVLQEKQDDGSVEMTSWQKVQILQLKYLSKLNMDWSELMCLFPALNFVEKIECPGLNSFPCDDTGVWRRDATKLPKEMSDEYDDDNSYMTQVAS